MWEPFVSAADFLELSPTVRESFIRFVNSASKRSFHPLDWRRFYEFVRVCHSRRARQTASDIQVMLIRGHFSRERADHLAELYERGRGLLDTRTRDRYSTLDPPLSRINETRPREAQGRGLSPD